MPKLTFRNKYKWGICLCRYIKVHIHRDIMAAESMTDMLVYEINGLSRPEYFSRQVCKK
jgi:hypothetical protein